MLRTPVLLILAALVLASPAAAATTIVPDRFDDPLPVGTSCAPGHPTGTCTLRAAVAAGANGDTVALAAGEYALEQGQLQVTTDITITGSGPAATTIRQLTVGKRVMEFDPLVTGAMQGLTITGGNIVGGPGANGSLATPVGADGGSAYGSAINARGTLLTLTLVTIVGNSSTGGKGGNGFTPASGVGAKGGNGGFAASSAIQSSGHVNLDRVTVAGNIAHGGDGGTGASGTGSNPGGAGGQGGPGSGAIEGGSAMVLVVRNSTISGNTGFAGAGGHGGSGGMSGNGGNGGRSVRGSGGAISSNGDVTLVNTTVTANEVHGGAGGVGGAGGIASTGGDGGFAEAGVGGGVALFNGAAGHFASATLVANGAFPGPGGGGGAGGSVPGATGATSSSEGGNVLAYSSTLDIRDSVIAGGVGTPSWSNCSVGAGSGTVVTSQGYNVEDLDQCIPVPDVSDSQDLDPLLGPLQDNGGPTTTMAPLSGSPLIDGGPATCLDAASVALTTDQRGAPRGTPCDIGAYEAVAPTATAPPSITGTPLAGETLTCQPGTFGGDGPQTTETVWLRDGQQAAAGSQYAIPAADVGHTLACRMTATNAYGSASSDSAGVPVNAAPTPPVVVPAGGAVAIAKLSRFKISPKKLHGATKAKVTFTLSAPAKVAFTLCRRSGKKCNRVTKGAPKALAGKKGANTVRLKAKGLKRARYRLSAKPAGGKAAQIALQVVR
ncbi:MAG: hypothetical protein QOH62_3886 [Solirubrobacteraceae bacterium]|nr:hypothetical protein [Solirubrobacteraceae bacterium]